MLQGAILLLCGIGGIVFSRFLESAIGIIICIALMVVFIILIIIDIMQTARHNALPSEVIIYKDGAFFLTDEYGETTKFVLDDILDMDYKLKVTYFVGAYHTSTTTWNYGRLRIWLRIPNNEEACTLITLKNIAEPDRVIDKIKFINGFVDGKNSK